ETKYSVKITFRQLLSELASINQLVAYLETKLPQYEDAPTAVAAAAAAPSAPIAPSNSQPTSKGALEALVETQLQAMQALFTAQLSAFQAQQSQSQALALAPAQQINRQSISIQGLEDAVGDRFAPRRSSAT